MSPATEQNPPVSWPLRLSWAFFCLGFFCSSWDVIFVLHLGSFNLKGYQLAFLLSLACSCAEAPLDRLRESALSLCTGLALPFLLLAAYYLSGSPWSEFPRKSLLYSGWLFFQLLTIWVSGSLLARRIPRERFALVALGTMGFLALVILVDQVAYFYGYRDGLIGFNQDTALKWGVSRPMAFSTEPSYVALFLALDITTLLPWIGSSLLSGRRPLSLLAVAIALAASLALLFTASRTGWLAFALGLLAVLGLEFRRSGRFPWKLAGGIGLGAALLGLGFLLFTPPAQREAIREKFVASIFSGTEGSGFARLRSYGYAAQMARETHFLGTGMGASFAYWKRTRTGTPDFMEVPCTTEEICTNNDFSKEAIMSFWAQLFAEGGIPALGLFLWAVWITLAGLWRRFREQPEPLVQGALAAAGVFFFFGAHWIGNVARGDAWVWYSLWNIILLSSGQGSRES